MTTQPLPVLCDRCRAEGFAGEAEFAELAGLGDLLDFEPVPRRKRANGWDPDAQRAFIAALAVTGSDRQAAAAVGRNAFGVTQLCEAEDNEGFLAARSKAMEIFEEKERVRRSDGLLAALHGETARARDRHRLAWSGAATRRATRPDTESEKAEGATTEPMLWLERMVKLYLIKLQSERSARLEGHIAAADLYVRQATAIEVMMDLAAAGCGLDVFEMINELKVEGTHFIHVAETPFSRILDEVRRMHWEALGEPARPKAPTHLFEPYGRVSLEPCDQMYGGRELSLSDQERAFKEQHARDAAALVEWEARAVQEAAEWRARLESEAEPRRDHERRRDSGAANDQEPGEAGQPAPEGRQD
jgi:hypothetical protein